MMLTVLAIVILINILLAEDSEHLRAVRDLQTVFSLSV